MSWAISGSPVPRGRRTKTHTTCEQTCKHGIHAGIRCSLNLTPNFLHILTLEIFLASDFSHDLNSLFFLNPPRSVETTATTESPDLTWGLEWQACRNQTHLRGLFVLKRRVKQMFWFHFYFYHEALKQRSRQVPRAVLKNVVSCYFLNENVGPREPQRGYWHCDSACCSLHYKRVVNFAKDRLSAIFHEFQIESIETKMFSIKLLSVFSGNVSQGRGSCFHSLIKGV